MGRKFKSRCCLPQCGSTKVAGSTTASGLSFHEFPCDVPLREKWIQIIRSHFPNFDLKYSSRICSLHFAEDSFRKWTKRSSLLRNDAVPTIFSSPSTNVAQPVTAQGLLNPEAPVSTCDPLRRGPKCPQLSTQAMAVHVAAAEAPNPEIGLRGPMKRCPRRPGGFKSRTKVACTMVQPEVLSRTASADPKDHNHYCQRESRTTDNITDARVKLVAGPSLHQSSPVTVPLNQSLSPKVPAALLGQLNKVEEAAQGGDKSALLLLEQIWACGRPVHYFSRRMLQMCSAWRRCEPQSYDYIRSTQLFTLPCQASIFHYRSAKTVGVRGWELN